MSTKEIGKRKRKKEMGYIRFNKEIMLFQQKRMREREREGGRE